jgi:putative aldouronate transport system permease protein
MVKNAGVVVAMLPFLFIYPFAQRYFIAGVTMGSVKE